MKLEVVPIPTEDVTLAALRYVPEKPPRPTALLYAHGFTAGKYSLDSLASYLAGHGFEGLTFDFVGHKLGGTGGEMRHSAQAADNVRAALNWLRTHTQAQQAVLTGHSMGAAAVLSVAMQEVRQPSQAKTARLAGIVCLCLGREPTRGFESAIGQKMLAQRGDYVTGAPALQLLEELGTMVSASTEIGELPALFVAARQDVLVSVKHVEALAAQVGTQTSVAVIESSHLEAPDRARSAIIQWLDTLERSSLPGV